MIDSSNVSLIIFDTDGTIVPSIRPVYKAIKKAFDKAGWEVAFGEDEIAQYFGTSSGELYKFITPKGECWEKVREKARDEYGASFREYAETYPGVRETLEILRNRDYRLVMYSNASTFYFDLVKSALDIVKYFDYTECVGENNLTKPDLIMKIKKKFGDMLTAVVGDRVHDIEAARETDSLSIGALYGYGKNEPEQADIIIKKFSDLLDIFDRRLPIFEKIN